MSKNPISTDGVNSLYSSKHLYKETYELFKSQSKVVQLNSSDNYYTIKSDKMENIHTDLFLTMRRFLITGRILGIIPITGIFSYSYTNLNFRLKSFATAANLIVSGIVAFCASLSTMFSILQPKTSPLQIAFSIQGTVFRLWALFNYIYFLVRADSLIKIFKIWNTTKLFYPLKDKNLKRDIFIISLVVFTSSVLESCTIHMEYFPQMDKWNGHQKSATGTVTTASKSKSTLQVYYERAHGDLQKYFGYNPFLALFAFFSQKFVLVCWVYVDVLIIIFARALYWNFKSLAKVAEEILETEINNMGDDKTQFVKGQSCWNKIVHDHDELCSLLQHFENFLSPVLFGSYATNIYYICMQIIEGLSPDRIENNLIHTIFAPLSFLTLLLRIYLVSIASARINTYAHQIANSFKKCPIELYDAEVARVDKHVTAGPDIGLSGLGCFTVTKPFILSIINVVFTVEIVLLQGISNMPTSSSKL